jgi:hypothetical protein
MVDVLAIAERSMTSATVVTTTLVFKPGVEICTNPHSPSILMVGSIPIPKEVFKAPEDPLELVVNAPWRLDSGERDIPGLIGLQHRISSSAEGRDECYFIPSSDLREIIER